MDVWMKPQTNPKSGEEYYAYVLVYVDDLLHIHHDPEAFMKELKGVCRLKNDSLGPPSRYLGANVEKVTGHTSLGLTPKTPGVVLVICV